jgi:hypothetical protein
VLRADLPVLVCFATRPCPGRRALAPALERIALAYAGRLLVASVLVDAAPLLAEQYGVVVSPTLMIFQYGDRQGQAVGFIPAGLVDLLAEEASLGAVAGDMRWCPVEERFEDVVLIPLLQDWGFVFRRQAPCALAGSQAPQRGRIDLLVYEHLHGAPLTLIESKRQIRGDQDLRRAAAQAAAYATALSLPSFVVAAPPGLWIYRHTRGDTRCVAHVTSLELHRAAERPRQILLQLRPSGPAAP